MKRLTYRGDKRGQIKTGEILGPDAHGIYHEITAVAYHAITDQTHVQTRHATQPGQNQQRIRYYGGTHNPPPPQHHDQPEDTIEPQ